MYVSPAGLICNLPCRFKLPTQEHEAPVNILAEKEQDVPLNIQLEHPETKSSAVWILSSFYQVVNLQIPFELAVKYDKKLYDFRSDVFGIILPYPHGFDDELPVGATKSSQSFLHLFNLGYIKKSVSGTVEGVTFKNIQVYPMKRVVLTNSLDI
ncbi:MAG: hypothetical protein H0U49_09350 [Parachlamydiaceae bacterium]|nr:hypothetical protein [Parachlamydiaceae bacterium]